VEYLSALQSQSQRRSKKSLHQEKMPLTLHNIECQTLGTAHPSAYSEEAESGHSVKQQVAPIPVSAEGANQPTMPLSRTLPFRASV
jgi:hypothetical protein